MMKLKPNQTRTYDREGYKKRAACLCFRSEREDEEKQLFAVIAYPACLNLGIFSDKLFASSGSLKAVRSCRSSAVSQG